MKVRLKVKWMGRPVGTEIDLSESIAQRLIGCGSAESISDIKQTESAPRDKMVKGARNKSIET